MASIPPFGLRMQSELKARVEQAARANNRSLNAEIVSALEAAFPPPAAPELLETAVNAERFIRGFEDDELQEGVTELLEQLRSAIANAGGEPT